MADPAIALATPTYVPLTGSTTNPTTMTTGLGYGASPYVVSPYMMQPVYNPNVNVYEQQMIFRQKMAQQRKEFFAKVLKEAFPSKFVILHILLLTIYIIIAITFQTLEIVSKYGLYYVGSGYW